MRKRPLLIGYILCIWFVISLVTNIIGPLMPVIITDFHLSLALGGFLPFSFFLAYGVISIPAGALLESRGPKFALLVACLLGLAGSITFSAFPGFAVAIGSLFALGLGMAMLQVVINPLMRVAGGERNYSFFSVLAQLVFGAASYLGPMIFLRIGADRSGLADRIMALSGGPKWVALYWLFALLFVVALLVTSAQSIPDIDLKDEERGGPLSTYLALLSQRGTWVYFFGIAAYVGTEQTLADWMSQFLATYHGVAPEGAGAHAVGLFWGLMSLGCLAGLGLLKLFDARRLLVAAALSAMAVTAAALFGSGPVALIAFPVTGACLAVMFSIIFSLALNSAPRNHGALSGILCSGIVGGAMMPLLVGIIGEYWGLRPAMCLVYPTLAYMLGIGLWARPLVSNDRVSLPDLVRSLFGTARLR